MNAGFSPEFLDVEKRGGNLWQVFKKKDVLEVLWKELLIGGHVKMNFYSFEFGNCNGDWTTL